MFNVDTKTAIGNTCSHNFLWWFKSVYIFKALLRDILNVTDVPNYLDHPLLNVSI